MTGPQENSQVYQALTHKKALTLLLVMLGVLCLLQLAAAEDESFGVDDSAELPPNVEYASPAMDYVSALKREVYKKARGMKKCGGGKLCPAESTCCGTKQCCRKPWTCRYMARFGRFYCIP